MTRAVSFLRCKASARLPIMSPSLPDVKKGYASLDANKMFISVFLDAA
jgi:hypothetical protein